MVKKRRYEVQGRRWFDKTYGNTYHSVEVYENKNGEYEKVGENKFTYGYDDSYKQTAFKIVQKQDKAFQGEEGYTKFVNSSFRPKSREVRFNVQDVSRKRDL